MVAWLTRAPARGGGHAGWTAPEGLGSHEELQCRGGARAPAWLIASRRVGRARGGSSRDGWLRVAGRGEVRRELAGAVALSQLSCSSGKEARRGLAWLGERRL